MTAMPDSPNPKSEEGLKKPFRKKGLIIFLSVFLSALIAIGAAAVITVRLGEKRLRDSLVAGETLAGESSFDEEAVYFDGKPYYYNKNLVNILLIGVDKATDNKTERGQADALYLISADSENGKVNVMSISRNTLCEVDILDDSGEAYGTESTQICLAYAYGRDDKSSSENCTKAVSKLLYNIPINGYYTLHFNSISKIVNSVGGVSVPIPKNPPDTYFNKYGGKTAILWGEDAIRYLKMRGDSNAPRVERHKTFIKSFVSSAKGAVKKDLTLPFDMAKALSREAHTNINVSSMVYLATEALNWKLSLSNVEGKYSVEGKYEVLRVDEEKLRETVISNFYTEKSVNK